VRMNYEHCSHTTANASEERGQRGQNSCPLFLQPISSPSAALPALGQIDLAASVHPSGVLGDYRVLREVDGGRKRVAKFANLLQVGETRPEIVLDVREFVGENQDVQRPVSLGATLVFLKCRAQS